MGANDICDLCKQPLNFLDHYIFHVEHRNGGPAPDIEMTERYCEDCVSILGLDQHEKWIESKRKAKLVIHRPHGWGI